MVLLCRHRRNLPCQVGCETAGEIQCAKGGGQPLLARARGVSRQADPGCRHKRKGLHESVPSVGAFRLREDRVLPKAPRVRLRGEVHHRGQAGRAPRDHADLGEGNQGLLHRKRDAGRSLAPRPLRSEPPDRTEDVRAPLARLGGGRDRDGRTLRPSDCTQRCRDCGHQRRPGPRRCPGGGALAESPGEGGDLQGWGPSVQRGPGRTVSGGPIKHLQGRGCAVSSHLCERGRSAGEGSVSVRGREKPRLAPWLGVPTMECGPGGRGRQEIGQGGGHRRDSPEAPGSEIHGAFLEDRGGRLRRRGPQPQQDAGTLRGLATPFPEGEESLRGRNNGAQGSSRCHCPSGEAGQGNRRHRCRLQRAGPGQGTRPSARRVPRCSDPSRSQSSYHPICSQEPQGRGGDHSVHWLDLHDRPGAEPGRELAPPERERGVERRQTEADRWDSQLRHPGEVAMKQRRPKSNRKERFGFGDYLSPFTWRYGSPEMRELFSEEEKRATWRRVWLALAEAQGELGLVSRAELEDIRSKAGRESVDIPRAHELERKIRHGLMAELRTFADQAKVGGGKLHLGATSMDVEDNADIIIFGTAMDKITARLVGCLRAFREKIVEHRDLVCMAWTHLQPAEPTTLGYRFANYAQDLVLDLRFVEAVRGGFLRGKGVKGAVGTSASFRALLGGSAQTRKLEAAVMERLGIEPFEVATQTYPRKVDYVILASLASIAQRCHKFRLDLRVMPY